ncbi:MAG TPA: ABC transporter ATP-binding protein [Acidimicrobiales bacterium]|nr:ABC transporter ATP-binding protein [Acidimicrobiales bacterium]
MGDGALLEIEDLGVSYGAVRGLDGVALEVPAGGAVALLGPNGAGKTTLLRAVSGLLRFHGGQVTAGTIRFEGRALGGVDAARLVRAGIVQVLEGRHVFSELTVEENLRAGAFAARDRKRVASVRQEVLDLFPQLAGRLDQPGGLLSGGEQQMLAIGRALMGQPRLLLLDEPSLGLAPIVVGAIADALVRVHDSGVGILLVEQSSALAAAVTTDGYLLDTGQVRATGPTAQLVNDEQVRSVYLGIPAT